MATFIATGYGIEREFTGDVHLTLSCDFDP